MFYTKYLGVYYKISLRQGDQQDSSKTHVVTHLSTVCTNYDKSLLTGTERYI